MATYQKDVATLGRQSGRHFCRQKRKKNKTKEKRWNETKNPRRRNGRPAFQGRRFIKKKTKNKPTNKTNAISQSAIDNCRRKFVAIAIQSGAIRADRIRIRPRHRRPIERRSHFLLINPLVIDFVLFFKWKQFYVATRPATRNPTST